MSFISASIAKSRLLFAHTFEMFVLDLSNKYCSQARMRSACVCFADYNFHGLLPLLSGVGSWRGGGWQCFWWHRFRRVSRRKGFNKEHVQHVRCVRTWWMHNHPSINHTGQLHLSHTENHVKKVRQGLLRHHWAQRVQQSLLWPRAGWDNHNTPPHKTHHLATSGSAWFSH